MRRLAPVLGIVTASLACGGGPAMPSRSLDGAWGGDHAALTIGAAGAHAEFDCAHGDTTGPFTADARGAFAVSGTFVRERGGPIVIGRPPDSHPAVYSGSADDHSMALRVTLTDTGETAGTFALIRDAPARIVKCLLPASP